MGIRMTAMEEYLNLSVLDTMVQGYIDAEASKDNTANTFKRHLSEGNLMDLDNLVRSTPGLIDDSTLSFRLACQKLIELLRDPSNQDWAIQFLRQDLTPLALNAFPEAYTELKHYLEAFLYDENLAGSPVSHLWEKKARSHLAGQCCRYIRQRRGLKDPGLIRLLKFLALSTQSLVDAKPALLDEKVLEQLTALLSRLGLLRLVNDDRREAAPDAPSSEAKCPAEYLEAVETKSHIQFMMMKSLFGLSRDQTMRSLRQGNCCIETTLNNELSALPQTNSIVDSLVKDYTDFRKEKFALGKAAAGPAGSQGQEPRQSLQDGAERATKFMHLRDSSCSPPKKVQRCEIQTRGDSAEYNRGQISAGADSQAFAAPSLGRNIESVRYVGHLLRTGSIAEAIDMVNQLDAMAFKDLVVLHFQLQAARFKQAVARDQVDLGLEILQTVMTPLVQENSLECISKQWDELPGLLLSSEEVQEADLESLANSMETRLYERFGLQENELVAVVKQLMAAHHSWLESQMCPDYFGKFLGLEELQNGDPEAGAPSNPKAEVGSPKKGSNDTDEGTDAPVPKVPDHGLSEQTISEAMDITNVSRAGVISLLREFNGNLQSMLDSLYGQQDQMVDDE